MVKCPKYGTPLTPDRLMNDTRLLLAATHIIAAGTDPTSGTPFLMVYTPDHPRGRSVGTLEEAVEIFRAAQPPADPA